MTATDPARDLSVWMYVEGPARRVLRTQLLRRRDHLSAAAAEHTTHDQVGAELLWRAVEATEARLRDVFPDIWAEQHEAWEITDAARVHAVDDPRAGDCGLCLGAEQPGRRPQAA
jgi:hypothetical protein